MDFCLGLVSSCAYRAAAPRQRGARHPWLQSLFGSTAMTFGGTTIAAVLRAEPAGLWMGVSLD